MLCEIHRRKTAQPQVTAALNNYNHHHHHRHLHPQSSMVSNTHYGYFPFPSRVSISPPDSDEQTTNWCDSPPLSSTTGGGGSNNNNSVTALSEDNERLRRSNNLLISELAHMKKLYNDIIYFVQNHVKPVTPSNSYSPSLLLCAPNQHHFGYYPNSPKPQVQVLNEEPNNNKTKLFGVPLQSKKRLHPEYGGSTAANMETHKARLVLEKDDIGLNLMPSSTC